MTTATATAADSATATATMLLTSPSVDTLMRVSLACSSDYARFVLCGVSVVPSGPDRAEICATDGKVLAIGRITTIGTIPRQVVISAECIKHIRREYSKSGQTLNHKKNGDLARVEVGPEKTTVSVGESSASFQNYGETFPDYGHALRLMEGKAKRIPEELSLVPNSVQRANGILGIDKSEMPVCGEDFSYYRDQPTGGRGPLFLARADVLCVLMPVVLAADSKEEAGVPTWKRNNKPTEMWAAERASTHPRS